jgi:predicted nuclease of restriction endonuclease-like (RecB) superfamily
MAGKEVIQYGELLHKLKEKIKSAQQRVILAVNNELLSVYWEIGNAIAEQESEAGWGGKIVDKLAADLKSEFSDMKGLSPRNLRYMRDFALAYPAFLQQAAAKTKLPENKEFAFLQPLVAKLPWSHHQILLTKLKTTEERAFYIQKTAQNGWSKRILEHQIESGLHKTHGAYYWGVPLRVGLSATIFFAFKGKKGFPLLSLTQKTTAL